MKVSCGIELLHILYLNRMSTCFVLSASVVLQLKAAFVMWFVEIVELKQQEQNKNCLTTTMGGKKMKE